MEVENRIIVALDHSSLQEANQIFSELCERVGYYKVGLELASATSWNSALSLVHPDRSCGLFADAKLKDTPNTIAKAVGNIASYDPSMISVYVDGGVEMMQEAVKEAKKDSYVQMLGVTVPTSMSPEECEYIYGEDIQPTVLKLGRMAVEGGLDGVICSPQELAILNSDPDTENLLKVTPGIRPTWAEVDDQRRVMTPRQAVDAGADYLVIGRPITQPPIHKGRPVDSVEEIIQEIDAPA